jgi:hypothetical protein
MLVLGILAKIGGVWGKGGFLMFADVLAAVNCLFAMFFREGRVGQARLGSVGVGQSFAALHLGNNRHLARGAGST